MLPSWSIAVRSGAGLPISGKLAKVKESGRMVEISVIMDFSIP